MSEFDKIMKNIESANKYAKKVVHNLGMLHKHPSQEDHIVICLNCGLTRKNPLKKPCKQCSWWYSITDVSIKERWWMKKDLEKVATYNFMSKHFKKLGLPDE